MHSERSEILLDVTRLISRSWTGRQSTGLDRVCYAYLRRFRNRARAVIQHRGVVKVFDPKMSKELFDLLLAPSAGFKLKLAAILPRLLASSDECDDLSGIAYLNVSHTDFDLDEHFEWIERSGLKSVYFVHDLIPVLHPELSRPHAVQRHKGRVRGALSHADQIIVSSYAVERDLRAFASSEGVPVPPVVVAPIAGQSFASTASKPGKPYFVCVGTIEPRKNHNLLFEVWKRLIVQMGAKTPRLVIIGQKGPMTGGLLDPLIQSRGLRDNIEVREKCTDAQLGELIGNANALLFPSVAEGFGLPLVEALAMGTPVIASDTEVFREISQNAATLLDPESVERWVEVIRTHATHQGCLAAKAMADGRFDPPSWDDHFVAVEQAIAQPSLKTDAACESSLAA